MSSLSSAGGSTIIQMATIPPDDNLGLYNTDQQGLQADFIVACRYEKDRKTRMCGITSPTGFNNNTVAFVQLSNPTLLLVVNWTSLRIGATAPVPDPDSVDPNWVLLADHWEPYKLGLPSNSISPMFRISGCYVYGHVNPNDKTHKDVMYPRPPWLISNLIDRTVPDSALTGDLLMPASSTTTTGITPTYGSIK